MLILQIIGTSCAVVTAVLAVITFAKLIGKAMVKTEKFYGQEAEERYEELLRKIPEKSPSSFGASEYKGGNKSTPQFEVERFFYRPQIMPKEWKKFTQTIRYYFDNNGKTMVRTWRL